MKKTVLLLMILFCSCTSTQRIPVSIDPVISVIQVDGKKNDLYVKANSWMIEVFTDSKSVIQFKDKEEGIVIGKYLFERTYTYDGYGNRIEMDPIYAIINIQVKDDASRISIEPNDYFIRQGLIKNEGLLTKEKAIERINDLLSSFETYMKKDLTNEW